MSFEEGFRLAKEGEHGKAVSELRKVVTEDPKNHKAWNALGVSLTNLGRFEEAEGAFQEAIRIQPDEQVYLKNREKNQKRQQSTQNRQVPEAKEPKRTSGVNRTVAGLLGLLFICMIIGGLAGVYLLNTGDGFSLLSIQGSGGNPAPQTSVPESQEYTTITTQGFQSLSSVEPNQALQLFDQAISQDPTPPRAWTGRGYALISQGRYEEAIQAFDEALKRGPGYQSAESGRRIALGALGRLTE